jgi:hypothetical protein
MEIHRKIEGWEVDIAHLQRGQSGEKWTTEEEELLREIFPTEDAGDILQAFPSRSWQAIIGRVHDFP